jgi:hypothetical protein
MGGNSRHDGEAMEGLKRKIKKNTKPVISLLVLKIMLFAIKSDFRLILLLS